MLKPVYRCRQCGEETKNKSYQCWCGGVLEEAVGQVRVVPGGAWCLMDETERRERLDEEEPCKSGRVTDRQPICGTNPEKLGGQGSSGSSGSGLD